MIRVKRRRLLAGAAASAVFPAIHARAQASRGVALVIGNGRYQWEASLPNVKRDAPDIAKCFQANGLKTELLQDAGRQAMQQAIDRLKAASRGTELSAFYFAGHGAAWGNDTYLVPEDADLANPNDVQRTLISASSVRASLNEARHRLLVFDNCRNNPADGWRQVEAERAASMNPDKQREGGKLPPPDTLILYSTAPGRIALDGPAGENSPFAAALLRRLAAPSTDLQSLEGMLRRDLLMATEGRQILWAQSTYQQPFTLAGGGAVAPAAPGRSNSGRIIELPNAYTYAQRNGLPMPPGVVAHRPAQNSPHLNKAGAFTWDNRSRAGVNPYLLIVLSIDDSRAEVMLVSRNDTGAFWRCSTATVSGNQIEFVPNYGRPAYVLNWSNANSGSATQMMKERVGKNPFVDASFTRVDG